MKTIKKYIKRNFNNHINVLTYNVCWECISRESKSGSAKNYGKRCGSNKSKHNKCFNNIVNLCSNFPYTFICLQEGNIELANEIILKLIKKNKGKYSKIVKKSDKEDSIIIYRSDLFKKGKFIKYGHIDEIGRPYLFQDFININNKERLYIGNIHGPHVDTNIDCLKWIKKYLNIIFKNQILNDKKIIIMGDFNKELKRNINIEELKLNLKVLNKGILKTVYSNRKDENGIDNILISKNIKNLNNPKTINIKLSSDHKPLTCSLKI